MTTVGVKVLSGLEIRPRSMPIRTSSVHEVEQSMKRGGSHPRGTADLVKVDDITDTPVTVVEYLIT